MYSYVNVYTYTFTRMTTGVGVQIIRSWKDRIRGQTWVWIVWILERVIGPGRTMFDD